MLNAEVNAEVCPGFQIGNFTIHFGIRTQHSALHRGPECDRSRRGKAPTTTDEKALRAMLRQLLDWEGAHVGFGTAVAGIPPKLRSARPPGAPHSPWQIVEHLRIAQFDILDFCVNPDYEERTWPDDYWPPSATPPSRAAWDKSLAQFLRDRRALQRLAADPKVVLTARIPTVRGKPICASSCWWPITRHITSASWCSFGSSSGSGP